VFQPLLESNIPGLAVRRGKVRDVYELDDDRLLIVASDRISAFDVIMPTPIPDKGRILTALSNFWFSFFQKHLPLKQHLLETDFAKFPAHLQPFGEQLAGRSVIVRRTRVIPIECVVRGYITGSGWKDYQSTGVVSGVRLPPELRQCELLPEPIFTPSTKAAAGHDMPISLEEASSVVGRTVMEKAKSLTIALYRLAADYARTKGILIADTKFEFGLHPDVDSGQTPILIDEALTPDSSRFWPADQYAVGRDQASFDKQFVRNYLETLSWNKTPPGPVLPAEVVAGTRAKYVEAYERLSGARFH
jgi:phosphoribosylaminoimidazole-succinocarboxamide synthase